MHPMEYYRGSITRYWQIVMEDTADQIAFHVIREANEDNDDQQDLFTCPTDVCMNSFSKYKDLEMHVHVNDCKLVPERHAAQIELR